jgi:hypothetical protein
MAGTLHTILVVGLLLPASAVAADYTVSYAWEAYGEVGTGENQACVFGTTCWVRIKEPRASLMIYRKDEADRSVSVELQLDNRWGCCVFGDARRTAHIDPHRPLHRLPIFEGKERRGNEVVINTRVGMLYLKF